MKAFYVGYMGGRTYTTDEIERAIGNARTRASREGSAQPIHRSLDGALLATIWPDGKIDLTQEGAQIA